jgi:hypothetical protein
MGDSSLFLMIILYHIFGCLSTIIFANQIGTTSLIIALALFAPCGRDAANAIKVIPDGKRAFVWTNRFIH